MNESFVVGLRRDEVLRRRAAVRRSRLIGGTVMVFLITLGLVVGVLMLSLLGAGWYLGLPMIVAFLLPSPGVVLTFKLLGDQKRWYDSSEVPPYALRMTPAALELGVDGAPAAVVLPWPAVAGLRHERRFGKPVVSVALQPGVTPVSPGVSGLEHPAAQATLCPSKWIKAAGFYPVAALDQPLEAIDQALRHFSNSTAGVRR